LSAASLGQPIQCLPETQWRASHSRGVITLTGRYIFGVAVFFVCMGWTFRMIRRVFDAFDRCGFQCLIGVGQLLHRLFIRVADIRESERTHTLARAVFSDLCRIITQVVQLRFQIAFEFWRALVRGFEAIVPLFRFSIGIHSQLITPRPIVNDPVFPVFTCRLRRRDVLITTNSFGRLLLQFQRQHADVVTPATLSRAL
jgi:hypothetical protein